MIRLVSLPALVLFLQLVVGCATGGAAPVGIAQNDARWATRNTAIMDVLDRYMDALNALDLEAHVATYHFPHYRHASGEIAVWEGAVAALPILRVPEADRLRAVRGALEPDWDRSEWVHRIIVQGDDKKVHVVTRFDRLRADGSVIKSFDSLYVMVLEPGIDGTPVWGIRGRSSFAP